MDNPEPKDAILNKRPSKNMKKEVVRETWSKQIDFIFAMVGYSVGLGNVWRFPYLCYRNGGGAFLLAYSLMFLFCGIPMLFLEVALGQYTKLSAIKVWENLPSMMGIGFGCAWVNFIFCVYNTVVMAWTLYYFVYSLMPGSLSWTSCDNWWNTPNCITWAEIKGLGISNNSLSNTSALNVMYSNLSFANATKSLRISSETEFWRHNLLQQSSGLDDMGTITNWILVGCFLVSWMVIYLCIFKGVSWSGKVVYVTVTLPYIFLLALFMRGVTLEGAGEGIKYLLKPNFTKLYEPQVWIDSGGQIFFSLGICFTVLITFGSFNTFNNNCYKQCLALACTCSLTSVLASFVIFGLLGHMAFVQEKNISDVATSGPGLVFMVYPVGLSLLPFPHVWSAIFFATLFLVGIDTQFASVEATVTTLSDTFPRLKRCIPKKEVFTGIVSLVLLICGLPLLTNGGVYLFELLNMYAASGISLLFIVFFEAVAIGWMYDSNRLYDNVKSMIGYYPNSFFKYCYKYYTPGFAGYIFIFYCINYRPLVLDTYVYPPWANAVGMLLSLSSMLCVPTFFILQMCKNPGSVIQKFLASLKPSPIPGNTEQHIHPESISLAVDEV